MFPTASAPVPPVVHVGHIKPVAAATVGSLRQPLRNAVSTAIEQWWHSTPLGGCFD